MAKTRSLILAPGKAEFPHVSVPDKKYNADGQWKCPVVLGGDAAQAEKKRIDALVDEAFERQIKTLSPAQQKKAVKYYPYDEELDDAGNPTGYIKFLTKQNAILKMKDGSKKHIHLRVVDANDEVVKLNKFDAATGEYEMVKDVWGGSIVRVAVTPRDIIMKTGSPIKAGIQLALAGVQILELKTAGQGGPQFGKAEGSFQQADEEAHEEADTHKPESGLSDSY